MAVFSSAATTPGKQIIPDALRSSGATDPKTAITLAEADADRRTVPLS